MNPIDDPEAYVFLVAGRPAPGVTSIVDADNEGSWDDKEAAGQTGASTTYKGRKLKAFKTRHELAVDPIQGFDDIAEWYAFVSVLTSTTSGPAPLALDVWHPDLAVQDIHAGTVRKIGALKHDGRGGATVDVEWKEYAPPKPKPAAGTSGSRAAGSGGATTYGDTKVAEATSALDALRNAGLP